MRHAPLWTLLNLGETWPFLALFYIVEFGVFALLAMRDACAHNAPWRLWWGAALALLLLAPWYQLGDYSDLSVKGIIPAQMLFLAGFVPIGAETFGKPAGTSPAGASHGADDCGNVGAGRHAASSGGIWVLRAGRPYRADSQLE